MSLQHALAGAFSQVPDPDRLVTAAGKKPTVGRKGHATHMRAAKSLKN